MNEFDLFWLFYHSSNSAMDRVLVREGISRLSDDSSLMREGASRLSDDSSLVREGLSLILLL